jgi:hypothetical protein
MAVCPGVGDSIDDDRPNLLCTSVNAVETEPMPRIGVLYKVTCDFSTSSDNQSGSGGGGDSLDPDPTERPAVLRLEFDRSEEPVLKARDPKPLLFDEDDNPISDSVWLWGPRICNSAGDPIGGLTETIFDPTYTFNKNVTSADWLTISDQLDFYVGSVNVDPFSISYRGETKKFAKETVWLCGASSEPGFENGKTYEQLSLVLRVRKDGWRRKVADEGHHFFPYNDVHYRIGQRIRDENGDEDPNPRPLDGRGSEVGTDGAGPKQGWMHFRTKYYRRFAGLKTILPEFS